jgi:hypothetical protein
MLPSFFEGPQEGTEKCTRFPPENFLMAFQLRGEQASGEPASRGQDQINTARPMQQTAGRLKTNAKSSALRNPPQKAILREKFFLKNQAPNRKCAHVPPENQP